MNKELSASEDQALSNVRAGDLDALIARLETATGADRELDEDLFVFALNVRTARDGPSLEVANAALDASAPEYTAWRENAKELTAQLLPGADFSISSEGVEVDGFWFGANTVPSLAIGTCLATLCAFRAANTATSGQTKTPAAGDTNHSGTGE